MMINKTKKKNKNKNKSQTARFLSSKWIRAITKLGSWIVIGCEVWVVQNLSHPIEQEYDPQGR